MIDNVEDYKLVTGAEVNEFCPHGDLDRIKIEGKTSYDEDQPNPLRGENITFLFECFLARLAVGGGAFYNFTHEFTRKLSLAQWRNLLLRHNSLFNFPFFYWLNIRPWNTIDYPFGSWDWRTIAESSQVFRLLFWGRSFDGREYPIDVPDATDDRVRLDYEPVATMLDHIARNFFRYKILENEIHYSIEITEKPPLWEHKKGESYSGDIPSHNELTQYAAGFFMEGGGDDAGYWYSVLYEKKATYKVTLAADIRPFVKSVHIARITNHVSNWICSADPSQNFEMNSNSAYIGQVEHVPDANGVIEFDLQFDQGDASSYYKKWEHRVPPGPMFQFVREYLESMPKISLVVEFSDRISRLS